MVAGATDSMHKAPKSRVKSRGSPALTIEELRKRLNIAEKILNNIVMHVNREAHESAKELGVLDFDVSIDIDDYLYKLENDFEYEYIDIVEDVLSKVLGNYYIDTRDMSLEEINKLYEESGFGDWQYDECIHFGFARVVYGNEVKNALIYTCVNRITKDELKFDIAVNGEPVG
jgi:hypothetical protein